MGTAGVVACSNCCTKPSLECVSCTLFLFPRLLPHRSVNRRRSKVSGASLVLLHFRIILWIQQFIEISRKSITELERGKVNNWKINRESPAVGKKERNDQTRRNKILPQNWKSSVWSSFSTCPVYASPPPIRNHNVQVKTKKLRNIIG